MMDTRDIMKLRNRGLSVFPVSNETKIPLVKWDKLQDTLPTVDEVSEWFSVNGRSVGVAMGPVSGLFLLDFDFTKYPESLKWYEDNKSRLPRTWSERTKSGGLHLYFKWNPTLDTKQTNTTSVLGKGVDTKGYGGYSKMTPSDGYSWINPPHLVSLAALPEWLSNQLADKGATKPDVGVKAPGLGSFMADLLGSLKEGNRNATFTRVAGSLRARGYEASDIFELLKGKSAEVAFPLPELDTICKSVGRYPIADSGVGNEPSDIESFLSDVQVVEWLVPSIIARRSIGFVAGLPETGKTWVMIDLAIECARNDQAGKWLGRFPVKPAKVLFVDQERFKGETQRRFKAVIAAKNMTTEVLEHRLFVRCGTTTRINLEDSYQAFRKYLAEIQPDIVIIDSFVAFHTVEENNRGEIQLVLERIKQLRNEFGCTFVFIDHENKGAFHAKDEEEQPSAIRMAGSIGKFAAAEFVLTVRKQDPDTSNIYHTKSTMSSTVGPFSVTVKNIGSADKISVEAS